METWINQFPAFLLVLCRILAFFTVMPFFSYRNIPTTVKIGISVFLAWIMLFTLEQPVIAIDTSYFFLIVKEVLVGIFIGLIASILMYAIQVAGGLIDMSMGLLIANVVDPQTGMQTPLFGTFLYSFTILFLLSVNGHHLLLDGIFYSYQFVPLEQLFLPFGEERLIEYVAATFNTMFIIAFQMAFPIVGCLFLVDLALGMISRAVPQMNVFVVGMPLKILVGLPLIMIYLSAFFMLVEGLFSKVIIAMRTMLQIFGGI